MIITPIRQHRAKACGAACIEMLTAALDKRILAAEVIVALGGLKSYGLCTIKLAKFVSLRGFAVIIYSQAKIGDDIKAVEASEQFLSKICDYCPLLTVDPKRLSGGSSSGTFHNVILTRYTSKLSTYIDPADGKSHEILSPALIDAWKTAASKASAHTVVLTRLL